MAAQQHDATGMRLCVAGDLLTVRPVELTDVDNLARMFGRLSRESTYFRFFSPLPRVPRPMLLRLADVDHCQREALVAFHGLEIVAMVSYDQLRGSREAELAATVDERWQGRGIGSRLAACLGVLAFGRGYESFFARTLPANGAALGLIRKVAPDARVKFAGGEYEACLPLRTVVSADDCVSCLGDAA